MKTALYVLVAILWLTTTPLVYGQTTVSGKIIGDDGTELVGVSVLEKGTTNGTISDINGSYRLSVRGDDPELAFSFIGYVTSEVPVNNRSQIERHAARRRGPTARNCGGGLRYPEKSESLRCR